ncbi:unnamed protein product [Pelagomonas calceolata]|uniref:Uncharacterized protein n=1 Tax=Pelagomonas calceolata TaxID=35677 RepID=A0A8J2SZ52_9STRA|nr:unnamed protein product [Pelagomonas calceolata]
MRETLALELAEDVRRPQEVELLLADVDGRRAVLGQQHGVADGDLHGDELPALVGRSRADGDDVGLVHLLFRRQVDAAGGLRLVLDALHEDAVGDGHEPPGRREEARLRSCVRYDDGVRCGFASTLCCVCSSAKAMPRCVVRAQPPSLRAPRPRQRVVTTPGSV